MKKVILCVSLLVFSLLAFSNKGLAENLVLTIEPSDPNFSIIPIGTFEAGSADFVASVSYAVSKAQQKSTPQVRYHLQVGPEIPGVIVGNFGILDVRQTSTDGTFIFTPNTDLGLNFGSPPELRSGSHNECCPFPYDYPSFIFEDPIGSYHYQGRAYASGDLIFFNYYDGVWRNLVTGVSVP